jgi:hypothetical protein
MKTHFYRVPHSSGFTAVATKEATGEL